MCGARSPPDPRRRLQVKGTELADEMLSSELFVDFHGSSVPQVHCASLKT